MNRFIVFILFFNVFINLAHIKEIVILEPSTSPFSKMVEKHVAHLATNYFEQVSSHDIQVIVNALLASYQCAKADLKYDTLVSKILVNLWKLKTDHNKEEAITKFITLSKKFIRINEQKTLAAAVWHGVTEYLDAPEQENAAYIFAQIAEERIKIVQEYLDNNKELFFQSCMQAQEYNQKAAQRIHSIANVFKAVCEMPFDGSQEEHSLAALNTAYKMALALEEEQPKLMNALKPILHHIEDVILMNIMLDSLYYAECYSFLKKQHNGEDTMILFDYDGFIPEDKRADHLPYVVYCNEGLH